MNNIISPRSLSIYDISVVKTTIFLGRMNMDVDTNPSLEACEDAEDMDAYDCKMVYLDAYGTAAAKDRVLERHNYRVWAVDQSNDWE